MARYEVICASKSGDNRFGRVVVEATNCYEAMEDSIYCFLAPNNWSASIVRPTYDEVNKEPEYSNSLLMWRNNANA